MFEEKVTDKVEEVHLKKMMLCKLFKMKSIMTNSDQGEEMVILSSHISHVWQEVVQADKMDGLGHVNEAHA